MATYLVGDLQGCYDELLALLEQVAFNPQDDELWLTGDLVARGPKSLECLRFVRSLGSAARTILGNHDLHLLSIDAGLAKAKPRDYLQPILEAPDRHELMHWLRQQPLLLAHPTYPFVMVHAGISPDWDLGTAAACAAEVEQVLRSPQYQAMLSMMYGNLPDKWSPDLQGDDRLRYIINAFTRMRFCYPDGRLEMHCKLPAEQAPAPLLPWYQLPNPLLANHRVVFGHWASLLGKTNQPAVYALDTGCVWGNHLTLLRWDDQRYFQQPRINR
ncbi:MAG: bis(5'-nucleosyl)-tetraphosphatase (symmetrical) ApaH [Plesiomonas sp.]